MGYNDLYKRQRNPDRELMSQIIEEAAEQRKEMEKRNMWVDDVKQIAKMETLIQFPDRVAIW